MDPWKNYRDLNRDQMRKMQDRKFRYLTSRCIFPFSPHYKRVLDEAGIDPYSIRSLDDLHKLPFTKKSDLATPDNPKAFRDFILQPDAEKFKTAWGKPRLMMRLAREALHRRSLHDGLDWEFRPIFMTSTTGRSAQRIPFLYTRYDLKLLELAGNRMVSLLGLNKEDRLVNIFPYAPHLAFWQVTFGGFGGGIFCVGTGGGKVVGTARNIQIIQDLKATAIVGVPGYMHHLLREAVERKADFSSLKKVVLGAEKCTPELKARMRSVLAELGAPDVTILGTYGLTEARMAWVECPASHPDRGWPSTGYHMNPDLSHFEVIDPDTLEPLGEGKTGELVYTPLDGRGSMVCRYRTGDIAVGGMRYDRCPGCGMRVQRISPEIYRRVKIEELWLSKVKGTLINLDDFAHVMSTRNDLEEWQVELSKRNNDEFGLDEVVVYIAPRRGLDAERVRRSVDQAMRETMEVSPNAVIVEPLEELLKRIGMETEMKEVRVVDRRFEEASRKGVARKESISKPTAEASSSAIGNTVS